MSKFMITTCPMNVGDREQLYWDGMQLREGHPERMCHGISSLEEGSIIPKLSVRVTGLHYEKVNDLGNLVKCEVPQEFAAKVVRNISPLVDTCVVYSQDMEKVERVTWPQSQSLLRAFCAFERPATEKRVLSLYMWLIKVGPRYTVVSVNDEEMW